MEFDKAKEIAIRYIGISKKTEYEVIRKLKQVKIPPLVITNVIGYIKELGYINDKQYVRSYYITCKRAMCHFTAEIKQKLLQKGIKASIIEDEEFLFLQENPEYDDMVKNRLILGKLKNYDEQKLYAYLYRRGYKR